MSVTEDVNALVKVKKIKLDLPVLPTLKDVDSVRGGDAAVQDVTPVGLVPPLTLEILTWDAAEDVVIDANNGTFTIKQAETAQIVDAVGRILPIDQIIYPPA